MFLLMANGVKGVTKKLFRPGKNGNLF